MKGIATVDMEASALFAVGKMKNVKVAAVFVIADICLLETIEKTAAHAAS